MANSNYVKIPTSSLRAEVPLGFDVYIHIAGKHVLLLRNEDSFERERLSRLKQHNLKHMYIQSKDENAYQSFLDEALKRLMTASLPPSQKSELLVGQAKATVQQVFANPEKKENFTRTQQIATTQVQHMVANKDAFEQMLKVESYDKSIYQHSMNVSIIAVGLAHFLGAPEDVCQVIGTGALMHDIGRAQDEKDRETAYIPFEQMSPEAQEKYRQHPRAGAEKLQGKKYISKDVLDIVLLHEERLDGKGYPAGVKKLDQIFQVVGLANMYDRYVTYEGKTHEQAYEIISKMKPAPYGEELIEGLRDVLIDHKFLQKKK